MDRIMLGSNSCKVDLDIVELDGIQLN